MVGEGASLGDTRVIDPEFALYGPVGFDLGAFAANLLMAHFAQPGHERQPGERADLAEWLLGQMELFWHHFVRRHECALARARSQAGGPDRCLPDEPVRRRRRPGGCWPTSAAAVHEAMLRDLVGFAGAEIIRRVIGFAHNLDFESIADARAACGVRTPRLAPGASAAAGARGLHPHRAHQFGGARRFRDNPL